MGGNESRHFPCFAIAKVPPLNANPTKWMQIRHKSDANPTQILRKSHATLTQIPPVPNGVALMTRLLQEQGRAVQMANTTFPVNNYLITLQTTLAFLLVRVLNQSFKGFLARSLIFTMRPTFQTLSILYLFFSL